MAALLIAAGFAVAQKVEEKKQRKRDKKFRDAMRYKDLQKETRRRISPPGSRVADAETPEQARVARMLDDLFPPPAYEDAVAGGGVQRGRGEGRGSGASTPMSQRSQRSQGGAEMQRRDTGFSASSAGSRSGGPMATTPPPPAAVVKAESGPLIHLD